MSLEAIHAAIPHRKPMLLVDEIVEQSDDHILCRKTFHEDEYFFQGHYPDFKLVPGVILCEAAMQAGAIALYESAKKILEDDPEATTVVPVATRMNDVKFKTMVRPGDTIDIHVTMKERIADAFFLKAKVTCGGKVAVRFEFGCTMVRTP